MAPLEWFRERGETKAFVPGPSPPEQPEASFRPWTPPARPEVAGFARSAGRTFRPRAPALPPPDELVSGVSPETGRASASRLPAIVPARRAEAPRFRVSPPARGPAPSPPSPPRMDPGRLELPPPLAEELVH